MNKKLFLQHITPLLVVPVLTAGLLGWGTHSYAQEDSSSSSSSSNSNSSRYWGIGLGSSSLDWQDNAHLPKDQGGIGIFVGYRPASGRLGYELNFAVNDSEVKTITEIDGSDSTVYDVTVPNVLLRLEWQYLFQSTGVRPLLLIGISNFGGKVNFETNRVENGEFTNISDTTTISGSGLHYGGGVEFGDEEFIFRFAFRWFDVKLEAAETANPNRFSDNKYLSTSSGELGFLFFF